MPKLYNCFHVMMMLPLTSEIKHDLSLQNSLINLLRTTLLIIAIIALTLMILIILMIMPPKNQYGCNYDSHYIDDNNDYVDNDRRMIMAKLRIMMMTILHVVPT